MRIYADFKMLVNDGFSLRRNKKPVRRSIDFSNSMPKKIRVDPLKIRAIRVAKIRVDPLKIRAIRVAKIRVGPH
jgi:hypothetical protein